MLLNEHLNKIKSIKSLKKNLLPEGKCGCKHCDKRFATVTQFGISLKCLPFVEKTQKKSFNFFFLNKILYN